MDVLCCFRLFCNRSERVLSNSTIFPIDNERVNIQQGNSPKGSDNPEADNPQNGVVTSTVNEHLLHPNASTSHHTEPMEERGGPIYWVFKHVYAPLILNEWVRPFVVRALPLTYILKLLCIYGVCLLNCRKIID